MGADVGADQALELVDIESDGRDIHYGVLRCPDSNYTRLILAGFPLLCESAVGEALPRMPDLRALQAIERELFGDPRAYRHFVEDKWRRPNRDAYAAFQPFNESTRALYALVPLLRNTRLIGSLNLGSADPNRFTPALGTDFIEHMGSIVAICLENVISNEMLKFIGLTDSLTGVYNRRYMDRRLLEEIARARRQGYRLSCMYIDLDHFKRVNDTVGHQGGDDVLREVCGRIKAELRMSDALGRFGGEEFVVLLIDADLESASMVAQRIRASVAADPVSLNTGERVDVTVSIGVAGFPKDAMDAKIQGNVRLEAVVLEDGTVGTVRITKSLDTEHGLDVEAVNAMKQWTFKPGTKDGKAVPVQVEVEMTFTLK